MKLTSKLIASLLLSLSALSAQATVIQLDPVFYDPLDDVQVTTSTPFSHTYDVTGLFDNTVKKVVAAVLNIVLTDPNDHNESYQIVIGAGATSDAYSEGSINNGNATFAKNYTLQTSTSLADLQADGKVKFTINATSGEFYFANSTLTFSVDDIATTNPSGTVPEPMTLGLFAVALLGLGFMRRRQN